MYKITYHITLFTYCFDVPFKVDSQSHLSLGFITNKHIHQSCPQLRSDGVPYISKSSSLQQWLE